MNKNSIEDNEIVDSNDVAKKELSSLVFEFNGILKGVINIGKSDDNIESYQKLIVELMIKNLSKELLENNYVKILRNNPNKPYFTIDRIDTKFGENQILYFTFEALRTIFHIDFSNDPYKYLIMILKLKNSDDKYLVILSFKDKEYMNKVLRNILFCYNELFTNKSIDTISSSQPPLLPPILNIDNSNYHIIPVDINIRIIVYEIDPNGELITAPREGNIYKLRKNIPKRLDIFIRPIRSYEFLIEKCFGILYSTSFNIPNFIGIFDEFSFEKVSETIKNTQPSYRISIMLYPNTEAFELFTSGENEMNYTFNLFIDVIIKDTPSAVRLSCGIKLKLYAENEKFWINWGKNNWKKYKVIFIKDNDIVENELKFLTFIESSNSNFSVNNGELYENSLYRNSPIGEISPQTTEENDVILSGTYAFDPDIPDQIVNEWYIMVEKWKQTNEIPHNAQKLLNYGIPSQLRQHVWLLLCGLYNKLIVDKEQYDELINIESLFERVILRDMSRTFTCHEYFKEKNGTGQNQLYRICKAYSNYDKEVGYCQGMSFIVANFLLHFDELTTFSVLIQIMNKYDLRKLYIQSFDELQSYMFILKRLIQTHIPALAKHLIHIGLEAQMFAPQWFLTIFTSKFPLGFVDLALDMYLSQGNRSLIQISLAMLKMYHNDILNFNFENSLKYLSNILPRKFCNSSTARELLSTAYSINLPPSSFEQLQIEFDRYKKDLCNTHDPLQLQKIEYRMLIENQMRLEQENSILANNVIQEKIKCNEEIERLNEVNNKLTKRIHTIEAEIDHLNLTITTIRDSEKFLKNQLRLHFEGSQQNTKKRYSQIIDVSQFKHISDDNSIKNDQSIHDIIHQIKTIIQNCDHCKDQFEKIVQPISNITIDVDIENIDDQSKSRIEELEMELALSKMKIADYHNLNEDLQRQIQSLQQSKIRKWFDINKK